MTDVQRVPTATVLVSADGSDWRDVSAPAYWLSVEDDDRLTDKAVVRLDDGTGVLADGSFEGLELRVGFDVADRRSYVFEGVVTGTQVLSTPSRQQVELTALDFTYRMSLRPYDPAEWKPGEALGSVVTRIVGRPEYDLVPFQISPGVDVVLDERRQSRPANVNEWEFVLDQAHRQGCLAFCEFDGKDASNFYFVPTAKVLAAEPSGELHYGRGSGNLVEFCYERSSATAAPVRAASTIDPVSGAERTAAAPAPAQRPALPPAHLDRARELDAGRRAAVEALVDLAATADAKLTRPAERITGQAARTADELARSPAEDPTCQLGFHGHGVAVGAIAMRAKSRVHISGVASWAEGDWYVRRATHVFQRSGSTPAPTYYTEFLVTR